MITITTIITTENNEVSVDTSTTGVTPTEQEKNISELIRHAMKHVLVRAAQNKAECVTIDDRDSKWNERTNSP